MVQNVKNENLKNAQFKIIMAKNGQKFYENKYLSNENGVVKFRFNPNDCNQTNCTSEFFTETSSIYVQIVSLKILK